MSDIKEKLKDLVIVIPSLDPDEKLMQVIRGMVEAGFPQVVVVNDGTAQEGLGPFREAETVPECTVLGYEVNRGKGHALKTAFAWIRENLPDCRGVITVDGDNQHTPEDTVRVGLAMEENPDKVIMGCRDFKNPGVVNHNVYGNRITSLAFNLLCGIKLSDTQTGLRGIPAQYLEEFCRVEGERFEYETNMLLYMKKEGIDFTEVKIATIYIDGNKTSHFRVFTDSPKIYAPIIKFALGSGMSTIIDLALFTVFCKLFSGMTQSKELLLATVCARILSSLVNYTYNKKAVFNTNSPRSSVIRYYILAVCQMLLSWLCLNGLVTLFAAKGFAKTVLKMVVDLILFALSFQIQREWVFKK